MVNKKAVLCAKLCETAVIVWVNLSPLNYCIFLRHIQIGI